MKKLWRQEWKYHLFFVLLAVFGVECCNIFNSHGFEYPETKLEVFTVDALEIMTWCSCDVLEMFLRTVPMVVIGILLLKKITIYWLEKDRCGREFFQSLPVTKTERVWFHLVMDVLTVVLVVGIGAVLSMEHFKIQLENVSDIFTVEIPWLAKAYVGMGITVVAYCVMVLSLLYLTEQIFVNGCLKVGGFVGCILMLVVVLTKLWLEYVDVSWVPVVYGFFTLKAVAGNYMSPTPWSSLDSYTWLHDSNNPPFLINGKMADYSRGEFASGIIETIPEGEYVEIMDWFSRLYDFTKWGSYVGQVTICLGIGILLFVIALHLAKKKDLSKEGLYFEKAKYPIALALSVTLYVMLLDKQLLWYQHLLNVLTVVIVFVFLCHVLSSNRRLIFAKKDRCVLDNCETRENGY